MNFKCKCSCHDLKTTTILPFFKWRTNGTTKTVPKTQSPRLYDVVGKYTETETQTETKVSDVNVNFTCPTLNYSTINYPTSISSDDGRGNTSNTADGTTQSGDKTSIDINTAASTILAAEK
ncbi:unnamed protein product [Parnassius apollo]|uniref:(apollo) hypothetical protein n=1 Tax=Parnassius apollo TaxID=110799 RepID=A0A8S3XIF3_PARAO|nr:unnamed protein product [Parnassius apollo]